MPLWLVAMVGFGIFFWLFVLLPSWIAPDAEVVECDDDVFWRR